MGLVFRDNFFSAGRTHMVDEEGNPAGEVDLRSAFGSAADIYDKEGRLVCSGKFPFLSRKWVVTAPTGDELGVLKAKLSFSGKHFEYDARRRGRFSITSPVFSREYEVRNEAGERVARFEKVNGWFEAGAFRLKNECVKLSGHELALVILGMHAIQKSRRNAAAGAAT